MEERRAWWVQVVQAGGPAIREVFGAVRISERLHWTQAEARAEGERFAAELGVGEIRWEIIDDTCAIGRFSGHAIMLRSILLPQPPPRIRRAPRAHR
jgi:hypothetical protein